MANPSYAQNGQPRPSSPRYLTCPFLPVSYLLIWSWRNLYLYNPGQTYSYKVLAHPETCPFLPVPYLLIWSWPTLNLHGPGETYTYTVLAHPKLTVNGPGKTYTYTVLAHPKPALSCLHLITCEKRAR